MSAEQEPKNVFRRLSRLAEDLLILATQKNENGMWHIAHAIYCETEEMYLNEKEKEKKGGTE